MAGIPRHFVTISRFVKRVGVCYNKLSRGAWKRLLP